MTRVLQQRLLNSIPILVQVGLGNNESFLVDLLNANWQSRSPHPYTVDDGRTMKTWIFMQLR